MASFHPCNVKNVGDVTFQEQWEGQTFKIAPNAVGLVPLAGAWCWFGKPDLVDGPRYKDRRDELDRLKYRYGAFVDGGNGQFQDIWEDVRPRVEVTYNGERIWTVVEDPAGEHLTEKATSPDEREQLTGYIKTVQDELAKMRAQLNELTQGEPQPKEVPEDSPLGGPRRRSTG